MSRIRPMVSIQIQPDIEQRLHKIARQTGQSEGDLVQFALLEYLDEQEDIAVAEDRVKNPGKLYTAEETKRELGL